MAACPIDNFAAFFLYERPFRELWVDALLGMMFTANLRSILGFLEDW
jgi:hypothetical protein